MEYDEKYRQKMSISLKENIRLRPHHWMKGRKLPKTTKHKISQSLMGNKFGIGNKNRLGKSHDDYTRSKIRESVILYNKNNPKPQRYCSVFMCDKKHYAKNKCRKHYSENRITTSRKDLSPELQEAMTNVRIRDNNKCRWFKCEKKGRGIHVHHIFPRSEYPELELVEQYMICYCREHHKKWHEMRGDPYHSFI